MNQHAQFAFLRSHGWVGVILIAVFWPLNWTLPGLRTAYLFFPLWLGYILLIDAIVLRRSGTSLFTRSRREFFLLFVASAPAWWLFEWINDRTSNWEYLGTRQFGPVQYALLCTISFSTVMPAVFETAELVRTFRWIERCVTRFQLYPTPRTTLSMLLIGLLMLGLTLARPRQFYPLVWVSLVFILEPLNVWLGRRSLLGHLQHGDWRPILSLALGALLCGFFWEMWNYYSYPKWIYHTPGAEYLYIFEMPLLGYAGYLPFALELHALYRLLRPGAPPLKL